MVPGKTWVTEPVNSIGSSFATESNFYFSLPGACRQITFFAGGIIPTPPEDDASFGIQNQATFNRMAFWLEKIALDNLRRKSVK
jgi:hypothetical protein